MTSSRPTPKAAIAAAIVAVLILIGCLRETGLISLNLYSARSSASSISGSSVSVSSKDPRRRSAAAMGAAAAAIVTKNGDPVLLQYVRDAISGVEGRKPPLRIAVAALNTDGAYWVPLYKTGACSYNIRLSDGDPSATVAAGETNGVHYIGTVEGEIDEKVTGICSVRHFQELVGQEVGKQVRAELEKYENAPAAKT